MGVSMLPRLAARVCSTSRGTASPSLPMMRSTARPKGTKVKRETSLVMSMLQKKGRKTRTKSTCRVVPVLCSRQPPR